MDYNGIDVFYKGNGASGSPIVLLHGWGCSSECMDGVYNYLTRHNRRVYSIDFPGFGKSDFPPESWGVYDYADCVQYMLGALGIVKPTIVGHSFGGRIAIILGARKVASKLVLADSAGLKPRTSLRKTLAIARYKRLKRLGKAPLDAGSADYAALKPSMKKVFVRIVNTHLDPLLSKIDVPTLLFWGKLDKDTPPYMARKMSRRIRDSGLVMLRDAGHFAYAERSDVFCAALQSFTAATEN